VLVANLTIKIDDDLLRRARIKALQEGTSVNRVVADYLRRFADQTTRTEAWRAFVDSARASTSRSPSGRDWSRDDIYRR
jgi:hypothetical protein